MMEKRLNILTKRMWPEVPCRFCGKPTTYTGTRECNNCHEVVTRLQAFLRSVKGQLFVADALWKAKEEGDEAKEATP